MLTVDLPIEELDELRAPLAAHGLGVVPLVAPTSTDDRIARLRSVAPPFVYYVSLTGVTGAALAGAELDAGRLEAIREAGGAPVAVGFGIKTPEDAAAVAPIADGVVVGSAVVALIANGPAAGAAARVAELVRALRGAIG